MKKIKTIAAALALMSTCIISNAHAEGNIDGMFGYKIGADFDSKGAPKALPDDSLGYLYQINPAKQDQLAYVDKYYVFTTPTSHKISGFMAIKDYKDVMECQNSREKLFSSIKGTYGHNQLNDPAGMIKDKDNPERGIKIECSDNRLIFITLDTALIDQGVKEKAKL